MFILKAFRPLFLYIILPFHQSTCLEHSYSNLSILEYKDVATESFELFNGRSLPTCPALPLMRTEAAYEGSTYLPIQDLYKISLGQPYSFAIQSFDDCYNRGDARYNRGSFSTVKSKHNNSVTTWEFPTSTRDVTPIWVWVVLPITITILLLMIAYNIYWKSKKARDHQDQEGQDRDENEEGETSLAREIEIHMTGPKKYRLNDLKSATGNFNPQSELGRGGFGIVYKGTLRGDVVAVKRISRKDPQGRKNMIAEVTTIGGLHHRNLVKLLGWCYESNELLLVYEYMPNGSLDNILFPEGEEKEKAILSWGRRYNIVCGVAQSLDYLHNECSQRVLHRDIKTSNIMLDSEFNACLGDFGLARMFKLSDDKTHHTTHEIAGTRAYMAPEIFFTGHATTQTDVYAFGVLVLEVVCGRRPGIQAPNGELSYNIVDWVWEFYKLGMICDVVDPELNGDCDRGQVECALLIGLACCSPNPYSRPSVRSALQALKGETIPPWVPIEKPAFVWPSSAPRLSMEQDHLISEGILSSLN